MQAIGRFILMFLFVSPGFSQQVDVVFTTLEEQIQHAESYHYVFGDSVNVRRKASKSSEKTGVLAIGQRIRLETRSEKIDTINGIKSHWYKIQTEELSGWIFGGFIAQQAFGSLSDTRVKFVSGVKRFQYLDGGMYPVHQVIAIQNNRILDVLEDPVFSYHFGEIRTLGSVGLALKDVLEIRVPCHGGCGCTAGELVVFWNGEKFSKVEELLGTADAWASESVDFIYPTDMEGIEHTIVKISDFFVKEISNKKVKRGITKEFFVWNGSALVPDPSRQTQKRFYTIEK
jgi:hypothetical protein